MDSIKSDVIGFLHRESDHDDWESENEICIPILGSQQVPVYFYCDSKELDANFIREADEALTNLLNMNLSEKEFISQELYKNLQDFISMVGVNDLDQKFREIHHIDDIWAYVHPSCLTVERRRRNDENIYITIPCSCDWEVEHGLQMVFRQGKMLTRVSGIDGHLTKADAFAISDEEDELLNLFNNRFK